MSERQPRLRRSDFRVFRTIPTRWHDNDVFGHVNNVVYYSWFDTAVNGWLIENGFLDPVKSDVVGYVVETGCSYFESVAYPETIEPGSRSSGWATAPSPIASASSGRAARRRRRRGASPMSMSSARAGSRCRFRRHSGRRWRRSGAEKGGLTANALYCGVRQAMPLRNPSPDRQEA